MNHPAFHEAFLADRVRQIERGASRARLDPPPAPRRRGDGHIALRLCTVHDVAALETLAALEGRSLPPGSFVLAEIDGKVIAAHPLDGGQPLADPFQATANILTLLRLRAQQLEPTSGGWRILSRGWTAVRSL